MQRVTVCCSRLQCVAVCFGEGSILNHHLAERERARACVRARERKRQTERQRERGNEGEQSCNTLQHTATHLQHTCSTLQHTCNTLATHLQHAADIPGVRRNGSVVRRCIKGKLHSKILQHTCNILQHTCNTLATHCNTLATRCNTLLTYHVWVEMVLSSDGASMATCILIHCNALATH